MLALSPETRCSQYTVIVKIQPPNSGILTTMNPFVTKFDQVLNLVEKGADDFE